MADSRAVVGDGLVFQLLGGSDGSNERMAVLAGLVVAAGADGGGVVYRLGGRGGFLAVLGVGLGGGGAVGLVVHRVCGVGLGGGVGDGVGWVSVGTGHLTLVKLVWRKDWLALLERVEADLSTRPVEPWLVTLAVYLELVKETKYWYYHEGE